MTKYVKATKTSLYNLARDFSNVPMIQMKYSNFRKIPRSKSYYLECGNYIFTFFACAGQVKLGVKEAGEATDIIKIPLDEVEKRGMVEEK